MFPMNKILRCSGYLKFFSSLRLPAFEEDYFKRVRLS